MDPYDIISFQIHLFPFVSILGFRHVYAGIREEQEAVSQSLFAIDPGLEDGMDLDSPVG